MLMSVRVAGAGCCKQAVGPLCPAFCSPFLLTLSHSLSRPLCFSTLPAEVVWLSAGMCDIVMVAL